VGLGNQPDRLDTSLAAPVEPWRSLMEEAEIWDSGSRPDSMPWSSEHGTSGRRRRVERRVERRVGGGQRGETYSFTQSITIYEAKCFHMRV